MDTGAVTDLRYINNAISTARMVLQHSLHSSLGGLQATSFAVEMGAKLRNLSTPVSSDMYLCLVRLLAMGLTSCMQHTAQCYCARFQWSMHVDWCTLLGGTGRIIDASPTFEKT